MVIVVRENVLNDVNRQMDRVGVYASLNSHKW